MSVEQPVRLHCFAHSAEGVFVFDDWAASVGPGVEPVPVLLPGCPQRRTAPRVTTHAGLLADVLPLFTARHPGPYALYGHGLGAMAALTVARALHEAGLPGPAFLAVGAWPPLHPAGLPDVRRATDAELLQVLSGRGAVPLGSDEGIWLRAVLPVLRADLELAQDLHEAAGRPSPAGPLTTPVLIAAAQDTPPAAHATADSWRQWTEGPVRLRTVPGRPFAAHGSRELPRLLGRACRVARRLVQEPAPVG
ncbi:surfactin synthase thioesterase subunit [Streptomyces phaeochromogenes]|jgi:surfactin synthase thioesterase subunit|uniref:thioesterase II family protein n=1 Tax=Streptomyces phaeochromogenes TaxID=1923 RepID=UPI002792EED8|nr:thioesterase domain-containing protein [Streptomyces phaeochromogenes]MDQ0955770.1 surfactin synthase thioesterase subunit [Streptomyces phaeochromogenes]